MADSDRLAVLFIAGAGSLVVLGKIFGQVNPPPRSAPAKNVINPRESLPTGWGGVNRQQFQSGHTNNMPTNESAEQGYGVGPERQWPHYPHTEQPNPYRNLNVMQRSGGDSYSTDVYRPEVVAYWALALAREQDQSAVKQRQRAGAVINQPASVPFVQTVTPGGY
jgi:hypothetical protein